jgi:hypothetical protein
VKKGLLVSFMEVIPFYHCLYQLSKVIELSRLLGVIVLTSNHNIHITQPLRSLPKGR